MIYLTQNEMIRHLNSLPSLKAIEFRVLCIPEGDKWSLLLTNDSGVEIQMRSARTQVRTFANLNSARKAALTLGGPMMIVE